MNYTVVALYRFSPIHSPVALREELLVFCRGLGVCGSLLIAPEGINGTLAGSAEAVNTLLERLEAVCQVVSQGEVKFSTAPKKPFNRLKVRLKKEIVTFKQPNANPSQQVGVYVPPEEWNALIAQPDVLVLDTRNTYETRIGTFAGAIDPQTEQFTDFATYVKHNLDPSKQPKIAMFCTGGIRCEKASAFMLAEGFPEVYHLKGGILNYLETIPAEQSTWQGDCYVFDKRVSVGHGLTTGNHTLCYSCGEPVAVEEQTHPQYELGVSCHRCFDKTTDSDKARFRMRQQQLNAVV
jgi:UPF0176 protein